MESPLNSVKIDATDPSFGSVQAEAENLSQEKSGYPCDRREVRATCDMGESPACGLRARDGIYFCAHQMAHSQIVVHRNTHT